jgi:hypothetical protein
LLLEHARASGATVLAGRGRRPARTADGWQVPYDGGTVHAHYLVDATGRHWLLGGQRQLTSPRTVALHARWPSRRPAHAPQTQITALADGWLWSAALPGGDVRVMAFVDPDLLMNARARAGVLFRQLLSSASDITENLDPITELVPVEVCDATSYRFDLVVDLDSIRVGEAAFGIDPLSSSGVQTAIQTGLAAAATIHCVLGPDGEASTGLEYYGNLVHAAAEHHQRIARRLYAEHGQHAEQAFWRRRSGPETPAPATRPVALAELLPHRVRLRPPAELREVPCRIGDRIVRQRAVTSPELDRPVAFLADSPLAPMLEQLEAAPSLADALRQWQSTMSPQRATAIATWLAKNGLLEAYSLP